MHSGPIGWIGIRREKKRGFVVHRRGPVKIILIVRATKVIRNGGRRKAKNRQSTESSLPPFPFARMISSAKFECWHSSRKEPWYMLFVFVKSGMSESAELSVCKISRVKNSVCNNKFQLDGKLFSYQLVPTFPFYSVCLRNCYLCFHLQYCTVNLPLASIRTVVTWSPEWVAQNKANERTGILGISCCLLQDKNFPRGVRSRPLPSSKLERFFPG